jgi:uncharacterized repeat protein (TIGR03803 family)
MRSVRGSRSLMGFAAVATLTAMLAGSPPVAAAAVGRSVRSAAENVLFSFNGTTDGGYPDTDLVVDAAGNLYGTTVEGGDYTSGTVFELTPSGGGWIHTVLYSFHGGADGGEPYKGVTLDAEGNLYGSAVTGGTGGSCEGGCGVVYKLTNTGGAWNETVLHDFTGGNDGSGPGAPLTLDAAGHLFGMTPTGGRYGLGVIFGLAPRPSGRWSFRVIHSFTGGNDGATGSAGRMIFDAAGDLYGVATVGGANGDGTAFRLRQTDSGRWMLTTLYAFKGEPDAAFPYGGLVFDAAGNLYGTTYYEGADELGAVYELTPTHAGAWKERVLYSFTGTPDGASSISNLVFDAAGNLFGTTSEGGASGVGTIFQLTPGPSGTWSESVAYSFTGAPDGALAYDGLVAGPDGTFYGATVHGGTDDEGAIYSFTP